MTEESTNLGELFAALAKAQGQMAAADKDRSVGFDTREDSRGGPQRVKYSYATLAGVWEACRKPLSENGLAVVQQVTQATGNSITINSILGHASGQSINSLLTMPVVGGTAQAVGSAITYARRYSLMALVGIVADEDDDGQEASGKGEKKAAPRPTQQANPAPVPQATPATVIHMAASPEITVANSPALVTTTSGKHWIYDTPTCKLFWAKARELGFTSDATHKYLGVTKMEQFKGTMEQALDQLQAAETPAAFPGEAIAQEAQP